MAVMGVMLFLDEYGVSNKLMFEGCGEDLLDVTF
jgi:hypothetical protein